LRSIDPRILGLRGRPALLQVDDGAIAPVIGDRIGEALAVTGRAMEVDEDDAVAPTSPSLRVPAPLPLIAELRLRSGVDHEDGRVLLALAPTVGAHHIATNGFVVPTGEAELLERGELDVLQLVGVGVRDLHGRLAGTQHKELRWAVERIARVDD